MLGMPCYLPVAAAAAARRLLTAADGCEARTDVRCTRKQKALAGRESISSNALTHSKRRK